MVNAAVQPERRCIVSGKSRPANELIRFVVGPDAGVVPDIAGKLPGRGIWTAADRKSVEKAVDKRLFARSAKAGVHAEADLPEQVERLLAESCMNLLGLARRAGEAIAGFDQVAALIAAGEAAVVLTARDAADNGRAKIAAKIKGYGGKATAVELFDSRELSLALGRENVVHAALRPGGLAQRFLNECRRLAGFRQEAPPPGTTRAAAELDRAGQ